MARRTRRARTDPRRSDDSVREDARVGDERARRPVDAVPTGPGPDAAAVARAFDLGVASGPTTFAARGELGRIWRLDTDRGSWAVKQLLSVPEPVDIAVDVALQQRAIAAGVAAPAPVMTPDGQPLAIVGADTVRVHTWAELLPGPVSASAITAAELLGRMHAAAAPTTDLVDPWFCEPVGEARLREIATTALARGAWWNGVLQRRFADLVALASVIRELDQDEPRHLCHCDFNPQNVLVSAAGDGVVVDWENGGPFWLHCELASTIAEFEVPVTELRAFLDAYERAGGPARIADRSSFAGVLAVELHLIEHYAERALDPTTGDEERDRAEFWLVDILEHLITVERVDAWTAAC